MVRDPMSGAFAIAGDDRLYVAPAGIDVGFYNGRMVQMHLDERGRVIDLTAVTRSGDVPLPRVCSYNGQSYSESVAVCQSGTQFQCERGVWRNIGTPCDADTSMGPSPRECVVGDASVASGSSICRRGTTFRCRDGQWVSVGTACS